MSLPELEDPFEQFGKWYAEVRDEPAITEPTAMCVATAGSDGLPAARMVLLKAWDRDGFVFYTNYESDKGRDLLAKPQMALDSDPLQTAFDEHIYFSKEASSGGRGFGGGGCGCN